MATNPFTVVFDYLPDPLHSPLTSEENRDLYTTRLNVSAAGMAAGADRIAHIFPRANVRFLSDPAGLDPSVLAQRYLDDADADPLPVHGIWIALGLVEDIKEVRNVTGMGLFPTVGIYHDVIIDRSIVRQSVIPLLNAERVITKNPQGDEIETTDTPTKLSLWLRGEVTIRFPDVNDPPAAFEGYPFEFPKIPVVDGVGTLSVSFLMMDGYGVDQGTLNQIIGDLTLGVSTGRLLRDAKWIIHIPVSYIYFTLPQSQLAADHLNHPLASNWPLQDPWGEPDLASVRWFAVLFSFAAHIRASITEFNQDRHRFQQLEVLINADPAFPVPRTGLFLSNDNVVPPDPSTRTVEPNDSTSLLLYKRGPALNGNDFDHSRSSLS